MSVVNRMLQDIDRRLGADSLDARYAHPEIRSVAATARPAGARPRTGWIGMLAVASIAALAAAAWGPWGDRPKPYAASSTLPVVAAAKPEVAALPVAAQPPASSPAQPPAPSPAPVASPAPVQPLAMSQPPAAVAPQAAPEARPAQEPAAEPAKPVSPVVEEPLAESAPRRSAARPAEQFRLSMTLSPLAPRPAAPPATASPTRSAEVPVRRVAAEETIDMARSLWKGGAREEALATLHEALAAAEATRNAAAAAPLARELARLQLVGQRAQGALDLLRRLEGLLAEDADAWALRGNAEQRLSLHTEAASSYLAALRLRPAEGKWMLGVAISLAADGRQEEARGWVDRARERGAITPSIAAYLQQLGIAPRP